MPRREPGARTRRWIIGAERPINAAVLSNLCSQARGASAGEKLRICQVVRLDFQDHRHRLPLHFVTGRVTTGRHATLRDPPSRARSPLSAACPESSRGYLLSFGQRAMDDSLAVGELQARALALIVLLAGHQVLLFAVLARPRRSFYQKDNFARSECAAGRHSR